MTRYWTDIARAYEQDLEVLEEGRKAFDGACRKLITDVEDAAKDRLRGLAGELGLELEVTSESEAAAGKRVCVAILRRNSVDWVVLNVWIGSAYGGPAGKVRIASWLDQPKDIVVDTLAARSAEARRQLGCPLVKDPDGDAEVIRLTTLDASSASIVEATTTAMEAALRELCPLVEPWARHAEVVAKAQGGLQLARQRLQESPLHPSQRLAPKNGWSKDGTLRYLEVQEIPWHIWGGIRLDDGALFYEHCEDPDNPRRATGFAERAAAIHYRRASYDGGVIMSGEATARSSEQEIAERLYGVFRAWIAHCAELDVNGGS